MKLPTACLNERDGCDEAELIARAKRCQEILRLSEQAALAEAERIRIANIKPLVWAKPTFDIGSSTTSSDTTATAAEETTTQGEEKLGKRKERQEEEEATNNTTMQHYSSYHNRDRLFSKPRRMASPEKMQSIVDFTNKWIPSPKRRTAEETEEDDSEEEEEETKCDRAASFSS